MRRAEAAVEEEGLLRERRYLGLDKLDPSVDEVLGKVIAGLPGRIDPVVVRHEIGEPLVRCPVHEAIEPGESPPKRPLIERPGGARLIDRRNVPLSDREGCVSFGCKHLSQRCGAVRDAAPVAREAGVPIGDDAHPDRVVVPPREKASTGGRTEGRGVEVVVSQATCRQAIYHWRSDRRAEAGEVTESNVIEDDHDDVRATGYGKPWLWPPRGGFGDCSTHGAGEFRLRR